MKIKYMPIVTSMLLIMCGGVFFANAKEVAKTQDNHSLNTPPTDVQEGNAPNSNKKEESQPVYSVLDKITFTGNEKITSKRLQKAISAKVGDLANEEIITQSMVKIAKLYQEEGMKVTITPTLHHISSGHMELQFDIHELPNNK